MRAKLNTSCSPAPARSTGFAVEAVGGSSSRSAACVGSESTGSSIPRPPRRSLAIAP